MGNPSNAATIVASGAAGDDFTFDGSADFFVLATSPANATTFSADLSANFADSYTMTVFAPDDWNVSIDGSGNVVGQPPVGASGEHVLVVTAQSRLILTCLFRPNIPSPSSAATAQK